MQIFLRALYIIVMCLLMSSCTEDVYEVYEVNTIDVLPVNAEKDKPKTDAQYISILYTNLYQVPIGPSIMLEAQNALSSIGDKQIAYDILVSKYMTTQLDIPTEEEMRSDPESFIRDTYKRFLVRQPTEAELAWMIFFIESHPDLTPRMAYMAFATSNEHFHY